MANILVVDDDILFAAMLSLDLLRRDHHCHVAASADAALARLDEDGSIDLVVTAVATGGLDGIELIREVREFDRTLPIVALSCGGSQTISSVFTSAPVLGVDSVLKKPLGTDAIATAILDLLGALHRTRRTDDCHLATSAI